MISVGSWEVLPPLLGGDLGASEVKGTIQSLNLE